jgi:hypothetical protein
MRSAVTVNLSPLPSVWRAPVSLNYLVTLVASALTTEFPRFCPVVSAQHTDFPSSEVDCERSPPLDLNPLPVDDLACDNQAAAALGAYLDRDAPSDAAWGDDPGELGDVVRDLGAVLMEAMRVRRQG